MDKRKVKDLQKKVEAILRCNEKARSDDFILISEVLLVTNPEVRNMSIRSVLENAKGLNIPSFAGITRARRTIFKRYPELNPEFMKRIRNQENIEYRKESRANEI